MQRVMGTETEYSILNGHAFLLIQRYNGSKKKHKEINSEDNEARLYTDPSKDNELMSMQNTMLGNGARFYVDMEHPEYSTPETSNARDLVIAEKAGEFIVHNAAKQCYGIIIHKDTSDGKGNSYGSHENYLIKRSTWHNMYSMLIRQILPFFVTRQIFAGAGKIGVEFISKARKYIPSDQRVHWIYDNQKRKAIYELEKLRMHFRDMPDFESLITLLHEKCRRREEIGEQEVYQISQRPDFFTHISGLSTTDERPIINLKDEALADSRKYMRFHVICGDANMSEVAIYLKTGTTSIVLDLIEDGKAPNINIINPVEEIKNISADQSWKWIVKTDKGTIPAVDIQRMYLEKALAEYSHKDNITDDILKRWESTLAGLESDPLSIRTIDWTIKFNMLQAIMKKYSLRLTSDNVKAAAIQYHNIDPAKSMFYLLQRKGLAERLVADDEISHAVNNPPEDTRAYLRGRLVTVPEVEWTDWRSIVVSCNGGTKTIELPEPLCGTKTQVKNIFDNYHNIEEIIGELRKIEGIRIRNTFL
jgi:Pup amidohydrolase